MICNQKLKKIIGIYLFFFAFFWITCSLNSRIGGGQSYSSKGKRSSSSSRKSSSNNYSSGSSRSTKSSTSSRPKGSSSSSGYSSGGYTSPEDAKMILIIVFIMTALIFGFIYLPSYFKSLKKLLSSVKPPPIELDIPMDSAEREHAVNIMQGFIPDFSLPLFMDFAQKLFVISHMYASTENFMGIDSYIEKDCIKKLSKEYKLWKNTKDIIVGNIFIIDMKSTEKENTIIMGIESNYSSQSKITGKREAVYEYSKWVFKYNSKNNKDIIDESESLREGRLICLLCGAPFNDRTLSVCHYCGSDADLNYLHWTADDILKLKRENKKQELSFGYYVEEKGTSSPTIFQRELNERMAIFKRYYPGFSESVFLSYVKHIFLTLQEAWSSLNWEMARPCETDCLFHNHLYWINRYKAEHIRNVLEYIHIKKIELVKMTTDKHYDALTVRIHASMVDYTITFKNKLIGGDNFNPRHFTEYWTFIRQPSESGEIKTDFKNCPHCGGIMKVGMMGRCEHCNIKISSGEFNWVLSLIEQDDGYTG